MSDYVEVFVAHDITQAYVIKAMLEDADIPVFIDNEHLQGAYGPMDGMAPRLLVPLSHEHAARDIIQRTLGTDSEDLSEEK
jgi:hypothetical protein